MAIDPVTEATFLLKRVPERVPFRRAGRPVSVPTVWRWALKGLRGVRLETVKIGGVRVTSDAALRRFFAAITDVDVQPEPERASEHQDAVDRELDRLGIG